LTLRSHYNSKDNNDSSMGRDELTSMLNIGLQMSFLSEIESMLRQAIGVDEFNVVRDTLSASSANNNGSSREVYNVEIGKYINDKTMLTYTAGVDYQAYKLGIRYDFNNRLSLNGDVDQNHNTTIGLEARIKF
jgi:translocation and assembly module TamB